MSIRKLFLFFFLTTSITQTTPPLSALSSERTSALSNLITQESLKHFAQCSAIYGAEVAYSTVALAISILIHEIGHSIFFKKYLNNAPVNIQIGLPIKLGNHPALTFDKPLAHYTIGNNTLELYPAVMLGGCTQVNDEEYEKLSPSKKITILSAGPLIGALGQYLAIAFMDIIGECRKNNSLKAAVASALASPLTQSNGYLSSLRETHRSFLIMNLLNLFPLLPFMDGGLIGKVLGFNEKKYNLMGMLLYPLFIMLCFSDIYRNEAKKLGHFPTPMLITHYVTYLFNPILFHCITYREEYGAKIKTFYNHLKNAFQKYSSILFLPKKKLENLPPKELNMSTEQS